MQIFPYLNIYLYLYFFFSALRIYPEIFVNMDNYVHDTSDEGESEAETNVDNKGND